MKYLIGLDVGTSGAKCIMIDETGKVVASSTQEYPLSTPRPGWAEQNPEDWWQGVVCGLRAILEKAKVNPGDILGLSYSGQMHGLVALDENNEVIRPAILWCDQRTQQECDETTEKVGYDNLIRITANPALTGFTLSKIIWVRKHEPDIYARCRHILLPKDYVRYMLPGDFATEVSDASGMQLLVVPHRCW